MPVQQFPCLILIAVLKNGAVVTGDDEQGVFSKAQPLQFVHDSPHGPVKFRNGIATQTHSTATAEPFVREARDVDIVRRQIHEERLVLVLLDEIQGMDGDGISDVLVFPQRLASAFHIANASDSVHDGLVMPDARGRLQVVEQFGMVFGKRFSIEWFR